MKLEILLQFIVPLTFLAIWALTSLLNREAQPLPPRPGRSPVPGGQRPGTGSPLPARVDPSGQSRYASSGRPSAPVADRPSQPRWSGTSVQARPGAGGRPGGSDEGIVILESENRASQPSTSSFSPSSAASARTARTSPARRTASRGRATQAPALKSSEPDRPRLLTGLVSQGLVAKKSRPLEITPLSMPITPIGTPIAQVTSGTTLDLPYATSTKSQPALTSNDLRGMLASPGKLREIALLGELLQKPIALRAPRHPR
ncbi:MAG: hypothetical protein ACLQGP_25190 [Isosphaeraceae bacterium]